MRKIEKILLYASAFAVIIGALFYAFAKISGITEARIGFLQFFTIIMFGLIISIVNMIFDVKFIHVFLRFFIHYATLLTAFAIIFIANGNINSEGPAAIFSAIVIFTFLYAIIFTIVFFVKKGISKLDDKLEKSAKSNPPTHESYKPRFK